MNTKHENQRSETASPEGDRAGRGAPSTLAPQDGQEAAQEAAEDTVVRVTPANARTASAPDTEVEEDTIVQLRVPAPEPGTEAGDGSRGGKVEISPAAAKSKSGAGKKAESKTGKGSGSERSKTSTRKATGKTAGKGSRKSRGRNGSAASKKKARKSKKDPDSEDTVVQPGEGRRWVVAPQEGPAKRFPDGWEYLPPDTVIKDRYVVLEMVGQGGMGQVYKALDLRREEIGVADPYVALKVLKPKLSEDDSAIAAFKREAATAQSLSSPRVVEIIDYDQDEDIHFIVSEFLYGESLYALLKRLDGKPMDFERAMVVVRDLAEALRYAHGKGVIHADFKPGNAFVCEDGHLKLLDFGVARTFGAASPLPRRDGEAGGDLQGITPAYASCEVLDGKPPDPRDDIFSLAVVAYRLLSGRHPFNGRNAIEAKEEGLRPARIKRLNASAWRTLRRALAFNRTGRVPTMLAFIEGFTADSFGANFQARLANLFGR